MHSQVSGETEAPSVGYRPSHTVMRKDKHIAAALYAGRQEAEIDGERERAREERERERVGWGVDCLGAHSLTEA